jgi:hypothetical protein
VVYVINVKNNLNDYLSCLCGIRHPCWKHILCLPKLSLWYTSLVLETTLLFTTVVFVVYFISVGNNFTVYFSCLCGILHQCWKQLYCLPHLSLWYTSWMLETTLLFTSICFVVYVINVGNNFTFYLSCLCGILHQFWKQLYCLPQLSFWYTSLMLENNLNDYLSCLSGLRYQCWKQLYCLPQLSLWYTLSMLKTTLLFTWVVFVVYFIGVGNNFTNYLSCLCGIRYQC